MPERSGAPAAHHRHWNTDYELSHPKSTRTGIMLLPLRWPLDPHNRAAWQSSGSRRWSHGIHGRARRHKRNAKHMPVTTHPASCGSAPNQKACTLDCARSAPPGVVPASVLGPRMPSKGVQVMNDHHQSGLCRPCRVRGFHCYRPFVAVRRLECSMAADSKATAAVSERRRSGPRPTRWPPAATSAACSAAVKSPSGPTTSSVRGASSTPLAVLSDPHSCNSL